MGNWSEEQLADYLEKRGVRGSANTADTSNPPFKLPGIGHLALGRLPQGQMNKTEAAYDQHLWSQRGKQVIWHKFEAVKLRLADKTFYTPDFMVLADDSVLEMHEVKGFWQDDARVKIKVAASLYPFRFIAVTRNGGSWKSEEF
jgi:hypothetical protein